MWKSLMERARTPDVRVRRSRWYSDYYEGYAEHREEDETGKVRIRRYFAGNYWRRNLPSGKRRIDEVLQACCLLGSLSLFLYGGSRNIPANRFLLTILLQTASVMLYLVALISLICSISVPEKLTPRQYREGPERLKKVSVWLAGLQCGEAAMMAIYEGMTGSWSDLSLCAALSCFGAAILAFGLHRLESGQNWQEVENPVKAAPEDYIVERRK